MSELAKYVHSRGYKRPLFVAGPQTYSAHLLRKETFFSYWTSNFGRKPDLATVHAYDPLLASKVVAEMLQGSSSSDLPDVIVCENDALAMGATDAVRYTLGLSVPGDIAITGFDDVPQADNPDYRLTTYRQPLSEMADYLVEVLAHPDQDDRDRLFLGTLVVRESA